jgi:hypothetical protein
MAVEVTDYRAHRLVSGKDGYNSFLNLRKFFLKDRTVFLVELNKNASQKRDKGMFDPLLIDFQAQHDEWR